MAEITMVAGKKNTIVDTIENFYQTISASSGGSGAVITAFTASNNGSESASYKAYIYDASGSMVDAVVPQKIVVRDRFDLGPSVVGHIIPPGGSLRMESSNLTVSFTVTGREL